MEEDSRVIYRIVNQILRPLGIEVILYKSINDFLSSRGFISGDLILANLHMTGLSGKDLLVGIESLGETIPVIVYANRGYESDLLHALRLGAEDYVTLPMQEAEVTAILERVIDNGTRQATKTAEIGNLQDQVINYKKKIEELSAMTDYLKFLMQERSQREIFQHMVECIYKSIACDSIYLLIRHPSSSSFILAGGKNLSRNDQELLNLPVDNKIAHLAELAEEPIKIYGKAVNDNGFHDGAESLLIYPLTVGPKRIGAVILLREEPMEFTSLDEKTIQKIIRFTFISLKRISSRSKPNKISVAV